MMRFLWTILLSVLVGLVAAGFVWYGWALAENLRARRAAAKRMRKEEEEKAPDDQPEPATDQSADKPR